MLPITIRAQRADDYEAILRLTYKAFLTLDYPGRERMDEHFLIDLLKNSPSVMSELCFVAECEGQIVGHILYTKSAVLHADGTETDTISFGPLSVLPSCHRQGVGAALVAHSMDVARGLGYGAVVITGVPEYYPKIGFQRGREYGLTLEDGTSPDPLMAYELVPDYLSRGGILSFSAPEYERCETDHAGCAAFHRQFMAEHFPGQVTLRPFWDGDMALMERWLALPHVAKWYEHPADWLHELVNRRGEFRFISHFIAEIDGVPMGFGQYYDCFFTQQYEQWNAAWRIGERQGETYSIDYLIGEEAYLRKGYGKEIVRLLTEKVQCLGARRIIVQPETDNAASCGALAANGYRLAGEEWVKEFQRAEI